MKEQNKAGAQGVPLYLNTGSKKAGDRPEEMGKSHDLPFLGGGRPKQCVHTPEGNTANCKLIGN